MKTDISWYHCVLHALDSSEACTVGQGIICARSCVTPISCSQGYPPLHSQ